MNRNLSRLFLALLLSALPYYIWGKVWSADQIPMVHLEDRTQYVCDPDGVLNPDAKTEADQILYRLQHQCGVQTVFIIANRVKDGDAFRMAQDVGNHYGVGDKKNRRGLVIVISVQDHQYFIAPGKGLEGDLTDVECNDIGRACIAQNMKQDLPDSAVIVTCRAMYNKFKTGKTGVDTVDEGEVTSWKDIFVMVFLILLFFGYPGFLLVIWILEQFGLISPNNRFLRHHKGHHDDHGGPPPFFFGGGGGFFGGGGASGGSFGGGSFGGGGSGGSW
ncbi:MAG: TPM domain-containing protein [Prevotella sp.]|jgi:uncharacterized protein|nr:MULTISPECIES: TPM domain-containing protein [unclassified Prevotella]MCH3968964.1 TPM domain-containing protein [Prevotella sp.]MCH3986041.1 TPM domain-containing protein [Prevotella sp.]MCH4017225.1 TPM domain-containing protein [Prevotella sp.]MCH4099856.1 TPM domain-containing protein [Prevotella sp.]MCH4186395.1 TPM domain-containing protein [Prevotella sp.]